MFVLSRIGEFCIFFFVSWKSMLPSFFFYIQFDVRLARRLSTDSLWERNNRNKKTIYRYMPQPNQELHYTSKRSNSNTVIAASWLLSFLISDWTTLRLRDSGTVKITSTRFNSTYLKNLWYQINKTAMKNGKEPKSNSSFNAINKRCKDPRRAELEKIYIWKDINFFIT